MKRTLVNQKIKWDKAPQILPISPKSASEAGKPRPFAFETWSATPELGRLQLAPSAKWAIVGSGSYLDHGTKILAKVRDDYRDAGFATRVILQDPRTHRGPTTACTIGFPTNLPKTLWTNTLRIFKRFVCRVHVDMVSAKNGHIWSIPHVEPDPVFHWKEHIEYSTLKHLDVRGPPAVRILRYFLNL